MIRGDVPAGLNSASGLSSMVKPRVIPFRGKMRGEDDGSGDGLAFGGVGDGGVHSILKLRGAPPDSLLG